jgi:hypothetical protein
MTDQTIIEQADICAVCGEPIEFRPGESYMASTGGKVWHMGCAPSRRQSSAVLPSEAMIEAGAKAFCETQSLNPRKLAEVVYTAMRATTPTAPVQDDDETYEIGKRDGYEKAVQDIDLLTGGDGEYRYVMGVASDSHCPDAETMKARIAERFSRLSPTPETGQQNPKEHKHGQH